MMEQTSAEKTLIHLEREFRCPVQPLFEAFLSAEEFRNWFCPPGFEPGNYALDPRAGGEYKCELLKNGIHALSIKGRYLEIERYRKLSFTLEYDPDISGLGECKVTVSFSGSGSNAKIILNQEIYKTIDTEGRTKGWSFMFSRLEENLNNKTK